MHTERFLNHLRKRLASSVPSASSLRKQGKGVVAAVRPRMMEIDPATFVLADETAFSARLNAVTSELKDSLPSGKLSWGSARKLINLFLRDVLYCDYLSRKYEFEKIRAWLEVPLDSYVAEELKNEPEGKELAEWVPFKKLTPQQSSAYQQVASVVAKRLNLARVDLDVIYWRGDQLGSYAAD